METPIIFTSKIDLKDYLTFNALLTKRRLPLMLVLLFLLTFFVSRQVSETANLTVFFAVFSLLVVAYFILKNTIGKWQAKKLFNSHLELSEPRTYTIDEKGVNVVSESTSGHFLWSVAPKVEELDSILLIYRGKNTAHIIRKSDLTSEQLQDVRKLLATVPGLNFKRLKG